MQNTSLLNSIIGPVMRGPSSSHAAGPYQIAHTIRQLALGPEETFAAVSIQFHPMSSFAAVYQNQGSDEGFAAGLLGVALTDEGYLDALPRLRSGDGFPLTFDICADVPRDHPNRVRFDVCVRQSAGDTRTDTFEAVSTGGGIFVVDKINLHSIAIDGSAWTVLVEADSDQARSETAKVTAWRAVANDPGPVSQFASTSQPSDRALRDVRRIPGVQRVRVCGPTQLCVTSTQTLLTSSADLVTQDADLAAEALRVESTRLGVNRGRARDLFQQRLELMMESVDRGLRADSARDRMTLLNPSASRVEQAVLPPDLGGAFLQRAMAAALAAMEQNTNRGVVVAAPTAGSAGIVPGVLYALSAERPPSLLVDALQVMALVGGLFATRGSFAAETGGCAVETGASAAMAAGGLAYAMGANAELVFRAASLCLMNTMGLVCDPVAGEVEIPCHARNIAGVAHAHAAAIATLAGFDAVLPFDELVRTTVDVGRLTHADLLCTGRGGCATVHCSPKDSRSPVPVQLTPRNPHLDIGSSEGVSASS